MKIVDKTNYICICLIILLRIIIAKILFFGLFLTRKKITTWLYIHSYYSEILNWCLLSKYLGVKERESKRIALTIFIKVLLKKL